MLSFWCFHRRSSPVSGQILVWFWVHQWPLNLTIQPQKWIKCWWPIFWAEEFLEDPEALAAITYPCQTWFNQFTIQGRCSRKLLTLQQRLQRQKKRGLNHLQRQPGKWGSERTSDVPVGSGNKTTRCCNEIPCCIGATSRLWEFVRLGRDGNKWHWNDPMNKKKAFSLCFGSRLSFARICINKGSQSGIQTSLGHDGAGLPAFEFEFQHLDATERHEIKCYLHSDLDRLFLVPFPWVNEEKDHFEEEEADALINFVEHLDFDEFVVPSVAPNWNAQIESNWCLQFPRSEICNFAKPWVSKPWYTSIL